MCASAWQGGAAIQPPALSILKECIGQGHGAHVGRQLRVDAERDRHFLSFSRLEKLAIETEALDLLEMRCRQPRRNAGDGLTGHRLIGQVPSPKMGLVELARMHLHAGDRGANSHGAPKFRLATNSTVTVRASSTFIGSTAVTRPPVLPLKPVISHSTSYSGTIAKPKANIAAVTANRRRTNRRFAATTEGGVESCRFHHHRHAIIRMNAQIENRSQHRQSDHRAPRPNGAAPLRRVGGLSSDLTSTPALT
jgi:hypothetical protein